VTPAPADRLTPTAVGVVSRAWVIGEVMRVPTLSDAQRRQLVDQLCDYQPPRKHPLRNTFIGWGTLLGNTMLFSAVGLPGWAGFVVALVLLAALARALAVRALRWRLDRLLTDAGHPPAGIGERPH